MFFTPNLIVGVTIMAVGIVLLLNTLGIGDAISLMKYWPALIVLFGASLVAQAFRPVDPAAPKRGNSGSPCFVLFLLAVGMFWSFGLPGNSWATATGPRATPTGIMGRAESRNVGPDVRSGRVAALMGRSSLDLRQVKLAPGEEVTVDVFVTMGRATVRIPDHWVVDTSALPVMGSVDEERFTPLAPEIENEAAAAESKDDQQSPRVTPPPSASGKQPRLRLRGFVLMGKVEVTS